MSMWRPRAFSRTRAQVVSKVNQWCLEGPFGKQGGGFGDMVSSATCIAFKMKNYKGTGQTKVYEFKWGG